MKQIDVLPDDVLLEIFDLYANMGPLHGGKRAIEAWQLLVHVCRRWRSLVFQSPRHLNLRLFCTPQTPAKGKLDVWPTLPLIVRGNMALSTDTDNVIATLGESNRVCEVFLWDLAGCRLEEVMAAMQVPFPKLTDLQFFSDDETLPVIPDSFLGGSAPSLRAINLGGIPFPGLPKLLLSATHLVSLWLFNIPHSGYISPEAIVSLISVLSSLRALSLQFESPQSRPDWQRRSLPPPKRSILPALSELYFRGVTEYLEELVTFIDVPRLSILYIAFFNQIDFDCLRLAHFIDRTPTLRNLDEAHLQFDDSTASVTLLYYGSSEDDIDDLRIDISCREPDWQLSSLEQACNSYLHPVSTVWDLYIVHEYSELVWKNDAIESTLWLQLLLPFTGVRKLYLSEEFAAGIAAALQELVGSRIMEVLPNLENIFVEGLEASGPFHEKIGRFVAARRQLSNHPIVISDWDIVDSDTESM